MTEPNKQMVLAIDFSLDRLDVSLRGPDSDWIWGHRRYDNNWPGYQLLRQELLSELQNHEPLQLVVAGESTGPYWWHAYHHFSSDDQLAQFNPELALLNPAHVKAYRKALSQQDKSDDVDPHLIDYYYRQVGVKHSYQMNERYLPLRTLSRAYARIIHSLASEKAYFLSILYLFASEYQRQTPAPFSDIFGTTSLYLLDEFVDFHSIADIPFSQLEQLLRQVSRNTLSDPAQTATRVQLAIAHSYPIPDSLASSLHHVLHHSLAHIRLLSDNKQAFRHLIELELDTLPEAQLALSLKGLGPILVAGCLSEIQDTSRFTTGFKYDRKRKCDRPRSYRDGQASVAKLAGLWWPQQDSGRVQGFRPGLAHERNTHLRFWLVQAAHSLRTHHPEYGPYFWKKYHETSQNKHKRALILTARKATRLIFALLHKGQRSCLEDGSLT